MADSLEAPQGLGKEYKIGEIIECLQSFDVVFTENRDILTVLPELIKRFMDLETKATGTATSDSTSVLGEFSGFTEEQEGKEKKWELHHKRQEKQINQLGKELREAKEKILELEARNKQNDTDVEMSKGEHRDQSDKYYKNKFRDLKAKLRMKNEDLQAKEAKIAELGTELRSKQEDYDKEIHRSRNELAKKEKKLAKRTEQLDTIKQEHDEFLRDQKTKIDELQARIAELEEELRAKQKDYEKETQRSGKELADKKEELAKMIELLDTIKLQHDESLGDHKTKIDELQASNGELTHENEDLRKSNENLTTELRHYVERLSHSQKEVKRLNDELGQFKSRLAGICEKRMKQDQRKVENILESNQQSKVEKDFKEFFDNSREDARDIIQSLYGSEEEIDVHVYYPRIACTILETAYEHVNGVKEAVVDLFKVATKNMVVHAPEEGYNFRLKRTEGSFDYYLIPIDELNTSEKSTDVLDALLISLKETAHICSLECLEKDVKESIWKKWTEWFEKDESFVYAPTQEVLLKLDGYIKDCIRLTWRMVTQLPPLRLEYYSPRFDRHIHKKTTFQNSTEKNQSNEESLGEEILCYLWPGLLDGGGRLILQGQVLCKMQRENLK